MDGEEVCVVRVLMSFICTFPPFAMKLLKADLAIPVSLLLGPPPLPSTGLSLPIALQRKHAPYLF